MLREDRTVWLDAPLIPARPALCHTPSALLPPPSTRGPGGLGVAWHAAQPHVQQPRALMQPCGDMPVRRPNAAHDLRPCEGRPRRLATCPCFSHPSGTGSSAVSGRQSYPSRGEHKHDWAGMHNAHAGGAPSRERGRTGELARHATSDGSGRGVHHWPLCRMHHFSAKPNKTDMRWEW